MKDNAPASTAIEAPPNGSPRPNGGPPHSLEDKARIFNRRERAVELYALGYSYNEIANKTGVSWQIAYADVQRHLEFTAKYFQATKFREQIAATYRATIKKAEALHEQLAKPDGEGNVRTDLDSVTLRLKALAQIDRGATSLARLYGLINEDPIVLANVHITPGQGLLGNSAEWAKNMDPERVKEMRETIIGMYKSFHPQSVPAEFTVEVEEEKREEPALGEETKRDPPTGPVTMSAG